MRIRNYLYLTVRCYLRNRELRSRDEFRTVYWKQGSRHNLNTLDCPLLSVLVANICFQMEQIISTVRSYLLFYIELRLPPNILLNLSWKSEHSTLERNFSFQKKHFGGNLSTTIVRSTSFLQLAIVEANEWIFFKKKKELQVTNPFSKTENSTSMNQMRSVIDKFSAYCRVSADVPISVIITETTTTVTI